MDHMPAYTWAIFPVVTPPLPWASAA